MVTASHNPVNVSANQGKFIFILFEIHPCGIDAISMSKLFEKTVHDMLMENSACSSFLKVCSIVTFEALHTDTVFEMHSLLVCM